MNILNVEMKAECLSLSSIREMLKAENADFRGIDSQQDTYFHCTKGRLKLRTGEIENSLIFYQRENTSDLKESRIVMEKFPARLNIREVLKASLGILVDVKKQREIYFIKNVKFHLDTVPHLGDFVEIEAIDETGSFGSQKLQEQANVYLEKFKPYIKKMVSVSYSDLLLEKGNAFKKSLYLQANNFLKKMENLLEQKDINLSKNDLDHLCFRVATLEEYAAYKNNMSLLADLLVETTIGGRLISNWKLHQPIKFNQREITVIELPSPKSGHPYPTGFEHAEYVINENFDVFAKKHDACSFDFSGSFKKINPEIRLNLDHNVNVKFHHQSLEEIIRLENRELKK